MLPPSNSRQAPFDAQQGAHPSVPPKTEAPQTAHLVVVRSDGRESVIEAGEGRSVMELIRDHGIEEMLAMCGGCCSCATCHVYVDPAFVERLPPMSDVERDMLEGSDSRQTNSRLSCQIMFTEALNGLRVKVAPED